MGATKQQKVTFDIAKGYSPIERRAISQAVIDEIVERSKRGIDKNGIRFVKYSKSYINSPEFKAAGKTTSVNMSLTGDMLAAIEDLKARSGKVTVGYESKSSFENEKADGHITGNVGKKRDFLGLPESAVSKILTRFPLVDTLAKTRKRLREIFTVLGAKEAAKVAATTEIGRLLLEEESGELFR